MEGVIEIMAKRGIDGLGIVFPFQLSFIDANQFFSFTRFLAKAIIRDPIKPRRETRFPPEAAEILVGSQKSLLREIVRERDIGANKLTEQTPDARLMIPDQFSKGMVIIIDKNASDEICIG
ncbi:MAG: hypothetical protein V7609_3096 [Verrucomicrobiota bacterium]